MKTELLRQSDVFQTCVSDVSLALSSLAEPAQYIVTDMLHIQR